MPGIKRGPQRQGEFSEHRGSSVSRCCWETGDSACQAGPLELEKESQGKEGWGRSAEGQRRKAVGKGPIDRVREGRDVSKGNRKGRTVKIPREERGPTPSGGSGRTENEKCPRSPGGFSRLGSFHEAQRAAVMEESWQLGWRQQPGTRQRGKTTGLRFGESPHGNVSSWWDPVHPSIHKREQRETLWPELCLLALFRNTASFKLFWDSGSRPFQPPVREPPGQ